MNHDDSRQHHPMLQWTLRLPELGENAGAWMYSSENPRCPIETLNLKYSHVPMLPRDVYVTVAVVPFAAVPGLKPTLRGPSPTAGHVIEVCPAGGRSHDSPSARLFGSAHDTRNGQRRGPLITRWSCIQPPWDLGEAWGPHDDNVDCPIENLTLRKLEVPYEPDLVLITLEIWPSGDRFARTMEIASESEMADHAVVKEAISLVRPVVPTWARSSDIRPATKRSPSIEVRNGRSR